MGEAQELQLSIGVKEGNGESEANLSGPTHVPDRSLLPQRTSVNWWIRIAIYSFLVIAGQSVATFLGRQYYDKGAKSKWMATLVQLCGFPIMLPYYCIPASRNNPITKDSPIPSNSPSTKILASVYVSLGFLIALDCYLYSVGLSYLLVSTFTLICASQLAFNAFFSFFLNAQKFTSYIVNSLVLLTISSTLLVFQGEDDSGDDDPSGGSKAKYATGFICTLGASAGSGLFLSLTQLAFRRVIKQETFRAVMDMIVCENMVATCVTAVGLFASGEWKHLKGEMEGYKLGKISYVMNVTWTAITWQLFSVGTVGLILEASSLFSNSISALGLPAVPVLAVIFFHEKMSGIKAIAMVLGIWGFVSYAYHHYIEDRKSNAENRNSGNAEVPKGYNPIWLLCIKSETCSDVLTL